MELIHAQMIDFFTPTKEISSFLTIINRDSLV